MPRFLTPHRLLLMLGLTSSLHLPGWALPPVQQEVQQELRFAPTAGQMTSDFGWRTDPITQKPRFHAGLDIAAPTGTPIYAPEAGQVVYSGEYAGYGNVVVLAHPSGLFTLYGHSNQLLVKVNDFVYPGTPIATVGATGRATGPHLHFEVHANKQYQDPKVYLLALQNQMLQQQANPNQGLAFSSTEKGTLSNSSARSKRKGWLRRKKETTTPVDSTTNATSNKAFSSYQKREPSVTLGSSTVKQASGGLSPLMVETSKKQTQSALPKTTPAIEVIHGTERKWVSLKPG